MKKSRLPLIVAIVFLLFAGLVLLAVSRIGQLSPVAPTAPKGEKAFEGSPVPVCTVNFQISPPSPTPLACSLQVCKAIKAAGVGLADWSLVPTATFSVELGQDPDLSASPVRAISYGTPWQTINFYNTDQPNSTLGEIPAVCKPIPPLGVDIFPPDAVHLTYKREVITTQGVAWDPPLYNDSNTAPITTFDQFHEYTDVLFDGDLTNDDGRDTNADGDITLRENNCNRTLAILNQYPLPAATPTPTPVASATPTPTPSATPMPSASPNATCQAIYVFKEISPGVWAQQSPQQLALLQPNDVVRFAVLGNAGNITPDFQKAHFNVIANGVASGWIEVTNTFSVNNTEYFYYDYTFPANISSYRVEAEVFSASLGWL